MIEGTFDPRTLARMNVALDRVCGRAADGDSHSIRERVARQIIRCASSGKTSLGQLTAAGQRALISVPTLPGQSRPLGRNGAERSEAVLQRSTARAHKPRCG
jgi:hypothetical protein